MALTISILGCGWLGFPLASRFVSNGISVRGATTSLEKLPLMALKGVKPYLLQLNPSFMEDPKDFFHSDIIVITIPFRRALPDPKFYQHQINAVIERIKQLKVKPHIIFTSSTAVYPSDDTVWDESRPIVPDNARSSVLLDIETSILEARGTVLRCGGLYGPEREIYRFFLKPSLLKSAQGQMNLLHLDDAMAIIEAVIDKKAWGQILNAVSDEHPTRQALYTHLAKKYAVECPIFDAKALQATGKIVSNDKIKRVLEYRFIHPDLMSS